MVENTAKFLYELGMLKRARRSGWWCAGVKDPETIAEHSFRAAIIARILAEMEGADMNKVTTMTLFHDVPETRINDLHKVGQRYIDFKKAETAAFNEQVERLPPKIAAELKELWVEMREMKTLEAKCFKDADYLECAIQAKEYLELGYKDCQDWINNVKVRLRTKSAKKLFKQVMKTASNSWYHGLKKLEKV